MSNYKNLRIDFLLNTDKAFTKNGVKIDCLENLILSSFLLMRCIDDNLSKRRTNLGLANHNGPRNKYIPDIQSAFKCVKTSFTAEHSSLDDEARALEMFSMACFMWLKGNEKLVKAKC